MPTAFELDEAAPEEGTTVLAPKGELDLFTAPRLRERVVAAIDGGATRLVVDLTETTFLDSSALGVLIGTVKRLDPVGGRLAIVNVDRSIAKVFEITQLDRVFTIVGDRDAALAAVRNGDGA